MRPAVVIAVSATLALSHLVVAAPPGPTLNGVVTDEHGRPIAKATVFICTAAPRQGLGYL
jgi:hypothetical protein